MLLGILGEKNWETVPPLSWRWGTEQGATAARGEGLFCPLGKLLLGAAPTFGLLDTNISHTLSNFPASFHGKQRDLKVTAIKT